jgi:hypothetical protein
MGATPAITHTCYSNRCAPLSCVTRLHYNAAMSATPWPDSLQKPDPAHVAALLRDFWLTLATLADLLQRDEFLLCEAATHTLRHCVTAMMLALNGIAYPQGTSHLNLYLGPSQRAALEKTLLAPTTAHDAWLGQAVALVVIYRWYAPQLVAAYHVAYPQAVETTTLTYLQEKLPNWPTNITTD